MSEYLPASAGDVGDTGDAGSIPGWGRSPGGGHGNPLRYACLENPMGRGAWWAAIHRVTKSWTQLKWLSTHTRLNITNSWTENKCYLFRCPLTSIMLRTTKVAAETLWSHTHLSQNLGFIFSWTSVSSSLRCVWYCLPFRVAERIKEKNSGWLDK